MALFNFMEVASKYAQFKQMLDKSGKNPSELLDQELQRRNLSKKEVEQLTQMAQMLSKLLGVK